MDQELFLRLSEENRACLLALRQIILKSDVAISETKKYGMPCFIYKNKALCYLWFDAKTKEPYILFVDGNKLNHPFLESGGRKRMKILRVDAKKDLNVKVITNVLSTALKVSEKKT